MLENLDILHLRYEFYMMVSERLGIGDGWWLLTRFHVSLFDSIEQQTYGAPKRFGDALLYDGAPFHGGLENGECFVEGSNF